MARIHDDINDMSNRNTLALLNEAITDVIDFGYTGAILILTQADKVDEDGQCIVCITNTGLNGQEILSTLQGTMESIIADAMEGGDDAD
jgi:hypothetical protein